MWLDAWSAWLVTSIFCTVAFWFGLLILLLISLYVMSLRCLIFWRLYFNRRFSYMHFWWCGPLPLKTPLNKTLWERTRSRGFSKSKRSFSTTFLTVPWFSRTKIKIHHKPTRATWSSQKTFSQALVTFITWDIWTEPSSKFSNKSRTLATTINPTHLV